MNIPFFRSWITHNNKNPVLKALSLKSLKICSEFWGSVIREKKAKHFSKSEKSLNHNKITMF